MTYFTVKSSLKARVWSGFLAQFVEPGQVVPVSEPLKERAAKVPYLRPAKGDEVAEYLAALEGAADDKQDATRADPKPSPTTEPTKKKKEPSQDGGGSATKKAPSKDGKTSKE